jgi:hypothetical protein
MSKISPGMSAISSHIGLVPLNLAKIPEPATTGGFGGQPPNWPTSPDLIAQTAYDLEHLHTRQESDNPPSNQYHRSYGWHNTRSRIDLRRSEQS